MPRPASDLDRRIVRAARKRFLLDGVDGASLRNIAREASTNIGMIYYYFPTKDDLFLAVIEDIYPKLLADLTKVLAPQLPVEERLRGLFLRFGQLSNDEHELVRIIMREVLVSSTRLTQVADRFMRGHAPLVMQTLAEGVRSGKLRNDLNPGVLMISTFMMAIMPQVMRRQAGNNLPLPVKVPEGEQLSAALVDVLLRGISKK